MMKYDIAVLKLATTLLNKIDRRELRVGFAWDKDSVHLLDSDLTADQTEQLGELMWFAGYQGGIYPDVTHENFYYVLRSTVSDPWAWGTGLLGNGRTREEAAHAVCHYLGRGDKFLYPKER